MKDIPQVIEYDQEIMIEGCEEEIILPEGLIVKGRLYFCDCPNIRFVTRYVIITGSISFKNCGLEEFYPNVVGKSLTIENCDKLHTLPTTLVVGNNCFIEDCNTLETMPTSLTVGGMCSFKGCKKIRELPKFTTIGSSLNVSGCTSLNSLGMNLSVGGNLTAYHCHSLLSLASNRSIGGSIELIEGCDDEINRTERSIAKSDFIFYDCPSINIVNRVVTDKCIYL